MAELPTGTITFLFTDIEGSTRLLQRLGGQTYGRVQDDHGRILRRAIAAGNGVEIRTEGDSFFAVFRAAEGALNAAISAQRDLSLHSWPDGSTVRVRMGMHTGEGIVGAGGADYVGIDVNRAARIAALGHGGQVLVSEASSVLMENVLPSDVSIRDLGRHRVKDIDRPEHIYDLVIDGLSADFPVLMSRDPQATNLPSQRTSFVGRERELKETSDLLGSTRLLTLTGPGGTGKTRLALKLAADQLHRYRDGVFFVDLSVVMDPSLLMTEIAAVLRVRDQPDRTQLETIADYLLDRRMLLLLDNMEQIVAGAHALGKLLDATRITPVVTSRVPLHLSGEHTYQIDPLPLPQPDHVGDPHRLTQCESVALFVERAAAVRVGFGVTPLNAVAIAEIVARVDGLPLALELVAGRVKAMSPQVLAERLSERLPLLEEARVMFPSAGERCGAQSSGASIFCPQTNNVFLLAWPRFREAGASRLRKKSAVRGERMSLGPWSPSWRAASYNGMKPPTAKSGSECWRRSASLPRTGSTNRTRQRSSIGSTPTFSAMSPRRPNRS
jgi:class 3 adenylate cyclase